MSTVLPLKTESTPKQLVGSNILIMGSGGTGKTYSLGTAVDWAAANDKEVFALFTENSLETLLGYWLDRGKPVPECLHYHQALTKPLSLASLISGADMVGRLSYEAVTKMQDPNRGGEANSFWKILKACSDFPDDRTGKTFGPIDKFDGSKIFIIDSLTELSNSCMKMVIGNKPTAAPPDYGVAQNNLMNFLRLVTQGVPCTFIITAHTDRLLDEMTQSNKTMVKSIGRALANDIPPLFSDVIQSVREGDKFYWDTAGFGVDTKTRSLGYRSKIEPNFAQILDLWKKRAAV